MASRSGFDDGLLAGARPAGDHAPSVGASPPALDRIHAGHYVALDALRGLCALLVCLFHFRAMGPLTNNPFVHGSWLFVDFFFVLSGFVIAANYRGRLADGMPAQDFALLRFGRLYPLHLAMLAAFVAFELAGLAGGGHAMLRHPFDADHSPGAIVTNLLLGQVFGFDGTLTWNHPSWSIAAEFWTYLLFAAACRWAGASLDRWLGIAMLAAGAVLAVATDGGVNVTYDFGLVRCVFGFAAGALLWSFWADRRGAPLCAPGWRATALELAATAGVIAFVCLADGRATLFAPLVFAAAVAVFAGEGGGVSRLLKRPLPLLLGQLSYSIYMVHVLVQSRLLNGANIIGRLTGQPLGSVVHTAKGPTFAAGTTALQGSLLTLLMLVAVVGVAWATHRWIELPGQRWARRFVAARAVAH